MPGGAPVLKRNDTVGEGLNLQRWRVVRKIGEGQFAEVYEVVDTFHENRKLALKLDRQLEVKTVERESRVLKRLQPCPCVVRLLEQGVHEQRGFMVLELLGMNVADSRKSCTRDGRWDAATTRAIGRHLLDAIAGMHQLGFIHRDIKPANFAITPRFAAVHEGSWHVIDFGLARRYVDDSGMVLPPRPEAAFRGSTSYASLAAHDGEDLGRRDDLWSWLYIVVEMLTGTLPWRSAEGRDREQVVRLKRECLAEPARLVGGQAFPPALGHMSAHLASLAFEADPDYTLLRQCLDDLVTEAAPAGGAGAAAQPSGLEEIADTPLSPPNEIANTPLSPPNEIADTPLSPLAEQARQPVAWAAAASAELDFSSGMVALAHEPAATASSAVPPPAQLVGSKRPRPEGERWSPAERDARSVSPGVDRHIPSSLEQANGGTSMQRTGSRHCSRGRSTSRSVSASPDDRRRDCGGGSSRGRSPGPYSSRGRSQDRQSPAEKERLARMSERERAGETVQDSDRGRYKDNAARRDEQRHGSSREEGYVVTSRCKHVQKYVTRIKQGDMSDGARDCKAQLKLISLTEGLGLAAYLIDNIVDEVSSRDAEQMATLLGELEEYVYSQRQRAKHRARRR